MRGSLTPKSAIMMNPLRDDIIPQAGIMKMSPQRTIRHHVNYSRQHRCLISTEALHSLSSSSQSNGSSKREILHCPSLTQAD